MKFCNVKKIPAVKGHDVDDCKTLIDATSRGCESAHGRKVNGGVSYHSFFDGTTIDFRFTWFRTTVCFRLTVTATFWRI